MRTNTFLTSAKSAAECFGVSEQDGKDIEQLRSIFENNSDFRAALEDYFNIYNDYAVMSADDFDRGFKEFINSAKTNIESSNIGHIKDELGLGQINDEQARLALQMEGKSKRDAEKIVERWKQNGIVKSSVDKAIDKLAEYFGTQPNGDTIRCQDILTPADEEQVNQIAEDEGVGVQIGDFSVRVFEKPQPIESALIDKYIQAQGRLIKETSNGEINDDKSARLNDKLDNLYEQLIDDKDSKILYDNELGTYTIDGEDVKRYVIELLGDNFFTDNADWDTMFDSILPNMRDFADNTREIAACYDIYQDLGNYQKLISSTFDKNEAKTFKAHGFIVKSSKKIISRFGAGKECIIEIDRHKNNDWEMVSESDDDRGWTIMGTATIFDNKDDAKNSDLMKALERSGYSVNKGNLKISEA